MKLTGIRPGSDRDGPGYVVLAFTILFRLLNGNLTDIIPPVSGLTWWGLAALTSVTGQAQYRPGSTSGGPAGGPGAGGAGGSFGGLGAAADEDYDSYDDGFGGSEGEGSLEETIPGVPGDDYPIFAEVPDTSFVCDGLVEGGYYADVEAECQVFHICGNDGNGGLTKYSFLCPNGTIFQQQYFVCDWWFNVDCSLAEDLYSLNDIVAAEQNSFSSSNYEEEEEQNYSDFSRDQQEGRGRRRNNR